MKGMYTPTLGSLRLLKAGNIGDNMTTVPKLFESSYPDQHIRIVISAIKRVPNWVLYDVHQRGLWDDLFMSMLSVLCETDTDDLTVLYNASQRAIYRFLKSNGYRKRKKLNETTGKINSLWVKENLNEIHE